MVDASQGRTGAAVSQRLAAPASTWVHCYPTTIGIRDRRTWVFRQEVDRTRAWEKVELILYGTKAYEGRQGEGIRECVTLGVTLCPNVTHVGASEAASERHIEAKPNSAGSATAESGAVLILSKQFCFQDTPYVLANEENRARHDARLVESPDRETVGPYGRRNLSGESVHLEGAQQPGKEQVLPLHEKAGAAKVTIGVGAPRTVVLSPDMSETEIHRSP